MASSKASSSSRIDASVTAEAAFRTATAAASILARSKPDGSGSELPAPDLLLRHLDRAIAAAESSQASDLLSFSSSPPSFNASNLHPPSDVGHTAVKTKNVSDPRLFTEPPLVQRLNTNFSEITIAEHHGSAPVHNISSERSGEVSLPSANTLLGKPRDENVADRTVNEQYDARLADEAYRAAIASLAEGNFQKCLKLLYLALSKCPPDRPSAVAKIRRLIAIAVQQLQKTQR